MPRHTLVAGFLIPISCLIIASAIPAAGAIDCFKCVSMNGTNAACDDPFHNNHSVDILESPCMGGRKGRDGLFPATSCIKIAGVYDDTGERITVRGCALDSGTLTTDTEIIRMSHCGRFYYDDRYVHGCLQSCNDADACNSGHSLLLAPRQHSAWWAFFTTTNAATLASLLYTLLSGAGDMSCGGGKRRERRKTVGARSVKERHGSGSQERIKRRVEEDRNPISESVICVGDIDTTHRNESRRGTSSQSEDEAKKYRPKNNTEGQQENGNSSFKEARRAGADESRIGSSNFTLESRKSVLERNCFALGSDTNYNKNCDACIGQAEEAEDYGVHRRLGGGLTAALES